MTTQTAVRALSPSDLVQLPAGEHFVRAATSTLRAAITRRDPEELAEKHYGTAGRVPAAIIRSATSPATTHTSAWVADLVTGAVADFLVAISPVSAAAGIIRRGLQMPLPLGAGYVLVPTIISKASDCGGWFAEGQPIPVGSLSFTSMMFEPKKVGVICTLTRETAGVESFVRDALVRAMALQLDTEMFSTTRASDIRPGGIVQEMSVLTAKTGGGLAAFAEDVKSLVDALTTNGGGRDYVLVAAPSTAAAAKAWAGPQFNVPILASSAIAKNTVIAVETAAFVSVLSAVPEFRASETGVLHMDTSPAQIATGGVLPSGGEVRSLFQTATIALSCVTRIAWGLRGGGLVAQITGVSW
jgi:hypothetical protein